MQKGYKISYAVTKTNGHEVLVKNKSTLLLNGKSDLLKVSKTGKTYLISRTYLEDGTLNRYYLFTS